MKRIKSITALCVAVVLIGTAAFAQASKRTANGLDVLAFKAVPEGNYLVNLQLGSEEQWVNIEVEENSGRAVSSSDPRLKGLIGKFELIGNGVFMASFQNGNHRATQFWVFREDGTAAVKEVPDRGERQSAVPVKDSSLERPQSGNK